MLCVPPASEAVDKEAVVTPPLVLTLTGLPALLPSIWNCTVPEGVPPPGDVILIVAVNVTAWPGTDGLTEELTAVLVFALFTDSPPVKPALLPTQLASPLSLAVTACVLSPRKLMVRRAVVSPPE